jgi:hypothetical protein
MHDTRTGKKDIYFSKIVHAFTTSPQSTTYHLCLFSETFFNTNRLQFFNTNRLQSAEISRSKFFMFLFLFVIDVQIDGCCSRSPQQLWHQPLLLINNLRLLQYT